MREEILIKYKSVLRVNYQTLQNIELLNYIARFEQIQTIIPPTPVTLFVINYSIGLNHQQVQFAILAKAIFVHQVVILISLVIMLQQIQKLVEQMIFDIQKHKQPSEYDNQIFTQINKQKFKQYNAKQYSYFLSPTKKNQTVT